MTDRPSTCIIGAGASGIVACKALADRGLPHDCFEKGSRVGGLWVFGNDNGMSAAYRSLHINTSKGQMQFSDFPIPEDYPDFPDHELIARYFDAYVDHFGLRENIRFGTEVEAASRDGEGIWHVQLAGGERRRYDALIVANGHHWDPRWPDPPFPGHFDGIQMHSHDYLDPEHPHGLRDKSVVVVGMGNSAMDIACELGRKGNAARVFLAARSGVHIMPKYFGSRVLDFVVRYPQARIPWYERIYHLLPFGTRRWLFSTFVEFLMRRAVGRPEDFGLPAPRHRFHEAHPTISAEIHARLGSGDVLPKPNLAELCGDRVRFTDGSEEAVDAIIYATGYRISFPFFDPDFISAPDNDIALYYRVLDPRFDNLFFIGLIQPLCSIMPISQLQAGWVADYLAGDYLPPTAERMALELRQSHERIKNSYLKSRRHTIQIDCMDYSWELERERRRGRQRAERAGHMPAVPTRVGTDGTRA